MPKYIDDINRIIDSSSVAVLSGLSRVLFMQVNDYKARITTFIASVCFGLVMGIIASNIEYLNSWRDIIVAVAALSAKESIEFVSGKMKDPLRFISDIRSVNDNNKSNDKPKSD